MFSNILPIYGQNSFLRGEMYRNVQKCIEMYRNIQKWTEMYINVRNYTNTIVNQHFLLKIMVGTLTVIVVFIVARVTVFFSDIATRPLTKLDRLRTDTPSVLHYTSALYIYLNSLSKFWVLRPQMSDFFQIHLIQSFFVIFRDFPIHVTLHRIGRF